MLTDINSKNVTKDTRDLKMFPFPTWQLKFIIILQNYQSFMIYANYSICL